MADLVAQSDDASNRWRRPILRDLPVVLGRQHCQWSVPWDSLMSRKHAELTWNGETLLVSKLPDAKNPIFFKGQEIDKFSLTIGEHFVIGRTTFTLTQSTVGATLQMPDPAREQLFSRQVLNEIRFRDAERRLAILTELPELITGAATDDELFVRLSNVIFGGVSLAASVAVVSLEGSEAPIDKPGNSKTKTNPVVNVLHWDRRFDQDSAFQPSQRLIQAAISKGQSVLHVWDDPQTHAAVTMIDPSHDWAFVTPLPAVENRKLAVYISGVLQKSRQVDSASTIASSLQEDIKFTELVANILGSLLSLRHLQTRQAGLRSFFSPVVLDALQTTDPAQVFQPRECEVAVMFCDLRGFSAASERMSGDLLQLLNRVSQALGVTTGHILQQRGVVGDFHGDASMGFWGWPIAQPDRVLRACQAAINIHKEFAEMSSDHNSPLHGFQLGLGIATGLAVAGQIGTQDQVKVTAFGPVVNLASRLETMNRQLNTSILIDKQTLDELTTELARSGKTQHIDFRLRPLGQFLPVGLTQPIGIIEVLPTQSLSELTDQNLAAFALALQSFQNGDWEQAFRQLHEVPSQDRAKDLLTMLITQHNRKAPAGWDGVIRLTQK